MENSANLAAKEIMEFLDEHAFLDLDWIGRKGWNEEGLKLRFESIVKDAYGEPPNDESIPFV